MGFNGDIFVHFGTIL